MTIKTNQLQILRDYNVKKQQKHKLWIFPNAWRTAKNSTQNNQKSTAQHWIHNNNYVNY